MEKEAGLRRDTYSGSGGSQWPSQGPPGPGSLGPLCSEGGKGNRGLLPALGRGGSGGCGHGYGVLRGEARGPAEVWAIPGLAALVGIALSKRKCLSGGRKPGQPFLSAPLTLQGLEVSSRTGPSGRARLRRTQVATLVDDGPFAFWPSPQGPGQEPASAGGPAAFPGRRPPDASRLALKKQGLPGRGLRAGVCAGSVQPGSLGRVRPGLC